MFLVTSDYYSIRIRNAGAPDSYANRIRLLSEP
jgi:hypothetical protein